MNELYTHTGLMYIVTSSSTTWTESRLNAKIDEALAAVDIISCATDDGQEYGGRRGIYRRLLFVVGCLDQNLLNYQVFSFPR